MVKRMRLSRKLRAFFQCALASAVLALLTFVALSLQINLLTVSLLFLLVVVAAASLFGFWQASLTSVAAVLLLDYYFEPPLHSFRVESSAIFVALVTFEVIALAISGFHGREMRIAREAAIHRVGMEQLYELSRNTMLMDLRQPPGPQLATLIRGIFNLRAVALFDSGMGRQDRAGEWNMGEENLARECYLRDSALDEVERQRSQRVLRTAPGQEALGALVVCGNLNPSVVDGLSALASIAIDRHRSFEKEDRAETAKQREELRAAVMDGLAHELKTPLTALQTASSGLLELGGLTNSQAELVTLIDDQATRLNRLCNRLLVTAKLDGAELGLDLSDVNVKEVILEVLAGLPSSAENKRIAVRVADPALSVNVDRGLLAMILTQYIDNAIKYSLPQTPIEIAASESRTEALLSVHNIGSKIRIEERERVFDRFYRAPDVRGSVPGTGVGLSVARKAAEAQHGHVWVISGDGEGTTFFLSLPISARRHQ
jgi:two-component system sensor histidine kinase KdpD